MNVCLPSVWLAFFIYIVLSNSLFIIAMYVSESDMKILLTLKLFIDLITLFTFALLLLLTQGVCIG